MAMMNSRILFGRLLLSIACFQPRMHCIAVATLLPGVTSTASNESFSFNETLSSPIDLANARSTDGSHDSSGLDSHDDRL